MSFIIRCRGRRRDGPKRSRFARRRSSPRSGRTSRSPGALVRLLQAGVDVVRLNGAHCAPRRHPRAGRPSSGRSRRCAPGPSASFSTSAGRRSGSAGSTRGPILSAGEAVELTPRPASGRAAPAAQRALPRHVRRAPLRRPSRRRDPDRRRAVRLKVDRVVARARSAPKVLVGGPVRTGAGVNFPRLRALGPRPHGRRTAATSREGLEAGIDFVGLSFVRSAAHVETLRRAPRTRAAEIAGPGSSRRSSGPRRLPTSTRSPPRPTR